MTFPVFSPKRDAVAKPRNVGQIKLLVAVVLIGALGGVGWWWFFGSKPRVVLTVSLIATEHGGDVECWPTNRGEVAVLGGGRMTLVDLKSRKELWSVPVPVAVQMDRDWQESVALRFLKLQKWAEELSARRVKLQGDEAIKTFNIEAAKYASDLAVARADSVRRTASLLPPAVRAVVEKKGERVFGGDRSSVDKLNSIVGEDAEIRPARIAKRGEQIAKARVSLNESRRGADTRLKHQQLRDDEARLHALEQEQKSDEAVLAPKIEVAPKPEEKKMGKDYAYVSGGHPQFAAMGDTFWLAEGSRVMGFTRSGGELKTNMNLPGPVTRMVRGSDAVFFVAYAGRAVRYVVQVSASGGTRVIYLPVAEEKALVQIEGNVRMPDISAMRNEFIGGGSLGVAEVRLVKNEIEERQAIKPGAEEAAVQSTSGAGVNEAQAILQVAEHDAMRMNGGVERIDASTYEVSVRRPFVAGSPVWKGEFKGRVQCFSTPRLSLVTAGTKLVALDSHNAKVWESTLAAPAMLGDGFQWDGAQSKPCFEHGERLYFFDRAVLTAFQMSTGKVIWRFPSVGIRKVEIGGDGVLYVHSANLATESLSYLSELKASNDPVLMKVNAANGKIGWAADNIENMWASGKDLYSMRVERHGSDVETAVFPPGSQSAVRVNIHKLNPSTGKPRWEWFQAKMPLKIIADGKKVAILYADGLQVIHSTAL